MLARELKKKYNVSGDRNISVIAFIQGTDYWWHIHDDEEVPEDWAFRLRQLPFKGIKSHKS